jgi:hypothetical protein
MVSVTGLILRIRRRSASCPAGVPLVYAPEQRVANAIPAQVFRPGAGLSIMWENQAGRPGNHGAARIAAFSVWTVSQDFQNTWKAV